MWSVSHEQHAHRRVGAKCLSSGSIAGGDPERMVNDGDADDEAAAHAQPLGLDAR